MRLRISTLQSTVSLCVFSLCTTLVFGVQDTQQMQWSDSVVKTSDSGKGILVIPMEGQMHTDIRASLYAGLVDRIKEADPDLIVVELRSRDRLNEFAYLMGYGDRNEFNLFDAEDLIDIANVFYIELSDIPQVAWVKDSSGVSTVLALSWPTMYMSHGAFLRSTMLMSDFNYINAEDTRGKIRAFRTIHSKIIAEYGNRSPALTRAFIDPDVPLSGTWKGKTVEWEESMLGDFVIDPGEDSMPKLTGTFATEVGISEGLVASLEDVLLAEGIREYHLVGEDITSDIKKSVDDWREELDDAKEHWADAQQFAQWADSDEGTVAVKDRKDQLVSLRALLKIMKKNPPVTKRLGRPYRPGISIRRVEDSIEQIEELLKRMKDGGRSGGRGGGGGGRGGGSGR